MPSHDQSPLAQFTERLRDEPERATVTFRSSTTLGPGYRCEAEFRKHSVVVDEPPSIGGTNEGPNPIELYLGSMATCQAIAYRIWAEYLDIAMEAVEVDIEGDIDLSALFGISERARPGYAAIRLDVRFSGPDTAERYDELARAVEQACPLLDSARQPVDVSLTARVAD